MWAHSNQLIKKQDRSAAFTIVELLIVIVVIAILAAITIVAYNGIQDRARASAASAALSGALKKIKVAQVTADSTTALTCAEFSSAVGAVTTTCTPEVGDTKYQYSPDLAGTYCITATVGNKSYFVTGTNSTPAVNGCAGHGVGGVASITNLSLNPSVESNTTGYAGANGATVATSATRAKDGTKSVLVTLPSAGSGYVGVNVSGGYSIPTHFQANTTYTYSIWVYVTAGTVDVRTSAQGAGTGTSNCGSVPSGTTTTKDSWVRLSCQFTTAASGSFAIYVLNSGASTAGMTFYADSVMFTEGTTLYNYADGTYANWIWGNGTGTPNNSTSTGPQT